MNRSIPNILNRISNILEHRKDSKDHHRDLLQMLLDASEKPHQDEQETYPQFTRAELISNCFVSTLQGTNLNPRRSSSRVLIPLHGH